jgi:uncharacterized damage-inducible protein DinB
MSIAAALVPEYDHEMAVTRRLLARVPDAELTWKPHEKSMSLGELCAHLANLPQWCEWVLAGSEFDLATFDRSARVIPASRDALLAEYDRKVAAARAQLVSKTDPELKAPWTLKHGDEEMFTLPRISAIRAFVMNHTIHHRGQLTVYLRLKNVPLPPIYGPTADEQ